jgi:hypothetical protein
VLKLNGAYQLLVYADEVTLLGDNINIVQEDINFDANKVGLKVGAEKTKYMLLSKPECSAKL